MFDSIAGIPLHPLVVHAVVVLLPLACIGAIAVSIVPRWDRQFGFLVVSCAVVATGAAVVAKQSGEALASRVGFPTEHQSVARWVPVFAGLLLICVAVLWWLDRTHSGARSSTVKVVAAITIVAALVALGWVIVAGHTGATAVWRNTIPNTTPGTFK
jgi:uncharacterized membrane protein